MEDENNKIELQDISPIINTDTSVNTDSLETEDEESSLTKERQPPRIISTK